MFVQDEHTAYDRERIHLRSDTIRNKETRRCQNQIEQPAVNSKDSFSLINHGGTRAANKSNEAHYRLKTLATFLTLTVFLAGCAGHNAYVRGKNAELSRDYDTAMEQYRIAAEEDPGNIDYRLKYEQSRFAAAFAHFENGRRALAKNDLATAKTEFTRTLEIDPTHALAEQELESN